MSPMSAERKKNKALYDSAYMRKFIKIVNVQFNTNNEEDMLLWDKLHRVGEPMNSYIKRVCREDLDRRNV